jgi:antitoxin FitA
MQYGDMPSITIRDAPEEIRDELAARARLSGRSLQEYLRSELTRLASQPDPDALMARVRERTRHTGSRLPASQIVAHRDHDRAPVTSVVDASVIGAALVDGRP